MEVDNAPILSSDAPVDFDSVPSCSSSSAVIAMDAEEIHQHIREASQSPNSVPILTRFVFPWWLNTIPGQIIIEPVPCPILLFADS